jgi:carbon-monoxide dehydrogenase medium subunit
LTGAGFYQIVASMLLREVGYARPATVEQAVGLLGAHEGARALAGGQTLINVMKARAAAPDVLVDLSALEELRTIRTGRDGLELGAMVTYSQLLASSEVEVTRPIVAEVAATIADVQVRNRGTVGGNVCSNDPTNHLPPLLVALGARMTIAGAAGEREVPADEFFVGVYLTAVGPGELLTKITIPPPDAAGDGFAATTIGKDGTCIVNAAATVKGSEARVAIGCVSAVPELAVTEPGSVREAVRGLNVDPPADVHASADYRRHLAEVLAERAVEQAQQRARS